MVIAEIGDILVVPIDVTLQIDGFDNVVPTAGEEATVVQTLFSSIDTDSGEDLLNYFLRFNTTFDLVNISGTVVATVNELWFSEQDLTQKAVEDPGLPKTTQEINSTISANKKKLSVDLVTANSFLSNIPEDDPIFRGTSESIVNIMSANNSAFSSLKFNPNDSNSVANITRDVEGSSLVATDGNLFLSFLNALAIQSAVVTEKTSNLNREEDQSRSNATRAAESEAAATNRFIESLEGRTGAGTLHLTADTYTPVDWNKIEPDSPGGGDIFSEDLSGTKKAAQLFPLLNPSTVVSSGLV